MFSNYLLLILCLLSFFSYSQIISGFVLDKNTNEPLLGTSIYLDGTTIGTTTNNDGYFELEINTPQNASLIISFVGYDTQLFSLTKFNNSKKIYLEESANQLNEVVLGLDIWSREKKMRIFKSEFLGKEKSSLTCKILNEKDIILIYNSTSNTLSAYADKPIIIKNKYLGYELSYNIVAFEVEFIINLQGLRITNEVYYAGTTFFKELKKKPKNKILLNRKKEFHGSLVHFMRSLASKQLNENKFQIYFKSLPTNPYKYFDITTENGQVKAVITTSKLSVLYNNYDQSSIQPISKNKNIFYIDSFGNHSPTTNLLFSGVFGLKRISNMLPINYKPY